jgi:hypothetical protein
MLQRSETYTFKRKERCALSHNKLCIWGQKSGERNFIINRFIHTAYKDSGTVTVLGSLMSLHRDMETVLQCGNHIFKMHSCYSAYKAAMLISCKGNTRSTARSDIIFPYAFLNIQFGQDHLISSPSVRQILCHYEFWILYRHTNLKPKVLLCRTPYLS